jgi:hypothetical protein
LLCGWAGRQQFFIRRTHTKLLQRVKPPTRPFRHRHASTSRPPCAPLSVRCATAKSPTAPSECRLMRVLRRPRQLRTAAAVAVDANDAEAGRHQSRNRPATKCASLRRPLGTPAPEASLPRVMTVCNLVKPPDRRLLGSAENKNARSIIHRNSRSWLLFGLV